MFDVAIVGGGPVGAGAPGAGARGARGGGLGGAIFGGAIGGGGPVGACAAALLARGAPGGRGALRVALLEPGAPEPLPADAPLEVRVVALSRASEHTLTHAGAWPRMRGPRLSPYERMRIW